MAILFLVGAALVGASLVRRALRHVLDGAEQVLWGLVAGWMLSTLAAYTVARLQGRLDWRTLAALTIALWASAAALWLPALKSLRERGARGNPRSCAAGHVGLALVLALFAPVYLRMFWLHMLSEGPEGVYSGGGGWHDLGFHLTVTTSFLYGQNFPPIYTLFPPEALTYPFLPDFLTAALVTLGLSIRAALITTSVALSLAATGLAYTFALRVARYQREGATPPADGLSSDGASASGRGAQGAAVVATLLFLLSGGIGFVYFFADWRVSGKGLFDFLAHLTLNYTNMPHRHIQWGNLINALLPQRTTLFGLPAGLMIFTLFAVAWRGWSHAEKEGAEGSGARVLLAAGVLAGLLPPFHTHTYAAVGLVSGFLFILRPRRAWLAFWLPAVLLGLMYFAGIAGHVTAGGFVRFQPGWHAPAGMSWPVYWLSNFSPLLLLAFPAWLAAPRAWRQFYLAFVALKVVALLVVFTPNDYDNIKLLFYWHAATCALVGAWLARLWASRRLWPVVPALALACMASGLLAVWQENLHRTLFLNRGELAAATFVRERTAPHALFLAAPAYHQPVVSLAGRPVLYGVTDWVWSHGHPFAEREADVRAVYAGREDAVELLRYHRVDYVYFGRHERNTLRANEEFFDRTLPVVYRKDGITIYDARPLTREGADDAGREDSRRLFEPRPPREFASRVGRDPYQLIVEFPDAGFAVYRYYRVAFGRAPKCEEFIEDMRALGRGLYVGVPGWREMLERNKQALTDAWPEWRDEFRALHGAGSEAEYVDALYANAGVAPARGEREALVSDLAAGRDSRGGAVRRVAESRALREREYDAAYVLLHYFGYLRRDPGDPPDQNLDGFDFWLGYLRRTRDYRSITRVFIESGEYKDRINSGY